MTIRPGPKQPNPTTQTRSSLLQSDYPCRLIPYRYRLPGPTHPASYRLPFPARTNPDYPCLIHPSPPHTSDHPRPAFPVLSRPTIQTETLHPNTTRLASPLPVLFRPNPTALVMTLPVRPKPTTLPVSDQSVPTTLSSPIHPTLTSLTMLRLTRPAPTTPYSPIPTFSTCRTANHPYHFDSPHRNLTLQNSPDLPTLVASAQTTTQPLPCLTSSFRI